MRRVGRTPPSASGAETKAFDAGTGKKAGCGRLRQGINFRTERISALSAYAVKWHGRISHTPPLASEAENKGV
jgi:hypothetical protein